MSTWSLKFLPGDPRSRQAGAGRGLAIHQRTRLNGQPFREAARRAGRARHLFRQESARALIYRAVCCGLWFAALICSPAAELVPALVGGGRHLGGSAVLDSAIGEPGGSATGGPYSARFGFAGQLYELKTLGITAAPATVNEGSTRQLAASAALDDATTLSLAPDAVTWSVVGGPITSISAGGLALAATVYADTAATVRGAYQALAANRALTVLNLNSDDHGAYAADGLDDAWQVAYFGEGSANAAPPGDPDGDGQNNLFEYLAGTTPTNSASSFRLSITAPAAGSRTLTLSPVQAGRTYAVEYATLISDSFVPLTGAASSDAAGTRTLIDNEPNLTRRFYRVRISLP